MWLLVVVGVAALLLAALTDEPTGLVRIIAYWLDLWVDRAVGVLFVIGPFAFWLLGSTPGNDGSCCRCRAHDVSP